MTACGSPLKTVAAVKHVVAQDERDSVLADERFRDEESLRDAFGLGLFAVFPVDIQQQRHLTRREQAIARHATIMRKMAAREMDSPAAAPI